MNYIPSTNGSAATHARIKEGTSRGDICELSGTSQSTISQIENGRSTNIETLLKICGALKITLFDLLPAEFLPPDLKEDQPERRQLLGVINQMSDNEVRAVLTLLTSNIIPVLKSITPLVKAVEELDDQQRKLLTTILTR